MIVAKAANSKTSKAGKAANLSIKSKKRQHILTCAEREFAIRGVVNATMADIAKAAGVSKGALYLLFASKDELYLQLATSAARELAVRMRAVVGQGNGFDQAQALLRTYARYYLEDAIRFRLALGWLAPGFNLDDDVLATGAYREVIIEIMQMSVAAFERGQKDGSIRRDLDAPRTVLQLWGAIVGVLLLRAKAADGGALPPQVNGAIWRALGKQVSHPTAIDLAQLVDEFVALSMASIKTSPTKRQAPKSRRIGKKS